MTTEVTVLVSHECGHCHRAVDTIRGELAGLADVELTTVDVEENPEAMAEVGYQSCPCVLVGGALAFVGVPTRSRLLRAVENAAAGRGMEPHVERRYEGRHDAPGAPG